MITTSSFYLRIEIVHTENEARKRSQICKINTEAAENHAVISRQSQKMKVNRAQNTKGYFRESSSAL